MIHQLYKPTINDFEDNIALENSHFNNNLLTTDPIAFHNLVSYELFENIITAYTSDLQPIYLPDSATIIDSTFSAFPRISHNMKQAKVNGIPVPLKTKVSHFDVI